MDDNSKVINKPSSTDEISKFTDSYASFNRIINSLQRKYIGLEKEFTAQNEKLAAANIKLVELTKKNITATEFLKGILNSITAGVIAVDQNGKITHFNPAASIILGIPHQEPPGKSYRDVIPPGEPIKASALRAAETGLEVEAVEKRVELPDNSRLQLSVSTAILRDNENRPTGAVEVFHDLTNIKKMEQEIARLNTLAALGEMAATIAHEVRNPLSGIAGFATLLGRDLDDSDKKKELVKKIIRGVNSLNETVDTLLNYTRFEEVNKTEVDYKSFINTTIEQFISDNFSRLRNVRIELFPNEPPDDKPIILNIDRLLFRQVFFNVFSNAVDAFNNRGEIKIQIRKLPRQTAFSRYSEKLMLGIYETVVETIITDTGPGIETEHLEKIFAPFYTTKQGGNGLGLAVAWKIIKAHSGEIFAQNVTGNTGASLYLLIPTRINNIVREDK